MVYEYKATCLRVVDGDTFVMNISLGFGIYINGEHVPIGVVRLKDFNAPEIFGVKKDTPEWLHGISAKLRCEELLVRGNPILTLKTFKDESFEKYGRFLAEVILPDGRNLVDILREEGYEKKEVY